MSAWRPKLSEVSLVYIKDLWGYSSKIFLFNIFKYFSQNSDKLLIGYLLGPQILGLYTFAYRIIIFPVSSINNAVGAYLFPKFSRMQTDTAAIQSLYLHVLKSMSSIVIPAMLIVAWLSPIMVGPLFGEQWIPAIILIQLSSVIGITYPLISPVGNLMKALGHPEWLFNWSVFFTVVMTVCLYIGSRTGVIGIGIGMAITYIAVLPIIYYITAKLIPINLTMIWKTFSSIIFAALVLCGWILITLQFGMATHVWAALLAAMVGLILYGVVLAWLDKPFISNIFHNVINLNQEKKKDALNVSTSYHQ